MAELKSKMLKLFFRHFQISALQFSLLWTISQKIVPQIFLLTDLASYLASILKGIVCLTSNIGTDLVFDGFDAPLLSQSKVWQIPQCPPICGGIGRGQRWTGGTGGAGGLLTSSTGILTWFLMGVTYPFSLQSTESGRSLSVLLKVPVALCTLTLGGRAPNR